MTVKGARGNALQSFFSGMRFPHLVLVLVGLLALDFVVLDPLPFIDEIVLAVLAVMTSLWRKRPAAEKPPEKNVTPAS